MENQIKEAGEEIDILFNFPKELPENFDNPITKSIMRTILLNYKEKQSIIWSGYNKKHETINEEPLTLEFDKQKFYFYPSEIEITKKNNKNWINFKTKLEPYEQENIINLISKTNYKNKFDQKNVLLKLKYAFLETSFKILNSKLEKEKKYLTENNNNETIKEKIIFLNQRINVFKYMFKNSYKKIKLLNNNESNNNTENLKHVDEHLENKNFFKLKDHLNEISQNFANIIKILEEDQKYLQIKTKLKNLEYQNPINFKLNNNTKGIFLNFKKNNPWFELEKTKKMKI